MEQERIGMFWIPPHCAECQHEVDRKRAAWEVEKREHDVRNCLCDSGLPHVYASGERMLTDMPAHVSRVLRALGKLASGEERGLFLHGPAGGYKTSLAAAFLASEIRQAPASLTVGPAIIQVNATGRYVCASDLLANVQASYSREGDETRADIVRRYVLTPRLVLDDLGKEKASEHTANVIFQILDGRYRMQSPGRWTIITSNYSLSQLASRFGEIGEAIERRIAELTVSIEVRLARGAA